MGDTLSDMNGPLIQSTSDAGNPNGDTLESHGMKKGEVSLSVLSEYDTSPFSNLVIPKRNPFPHPFLFKELG